MVAKEVVLKYFHSGNICMKTHQYCCCKIVLDLVVHQAMDLALDWGSNKEGKGFCNILSSSAFIGKKTKLCFMFIDLLLLQGIVQVKLCLKERATFFLCVYLHTIRNCCCRIYHSCSRNRLNQQQGTLWHENRLCCQRWFPESLHQIYGSAKRS